MTQETGTLQQETNPRRPPPSQAGVAELLRAADRVRRYLATVMQPFGVTGQQYNVLRILRGARPEPLPTLEIAERMMERTPGITRLLDRLEKKGLVSRERCAEDRRCVLCSITDTGLELLRVMDQPVDAADEAVTAELNPREVKELIRLLGALPAGGG